MLIHPPNIHQENPDSKYSQIEQKGNKSDSLVAMKKVTKVTPTQRMWRSSKVTAPRTVTKMNAPYESDVLGSKMLCHETLLNLQESPIWDQADFGRSEHLRRD